MFLSSLVKPHNIQLRSVHKYRSEGNMSAEKGTKSSSDKPDAFDKTAQQSSSPIELIASDNVDLGRITYTKDEEKAVLKKIDCVILPMVCLQV